MSVPPLGIDGTLPAGVHTATAQEVFAAFPGVTPSRQLLNQVLQDVIPVLQQFRTQAPDTLIFIDGSYVTSKAVPSDIDVLLRSDTLDEYIVQQTIWGLANGRLVDIFVDTYTVVVANSIYDLFTHVRTNPTQPKGIIQLDI